MNTTISVNLEVKKALDDFGTKGESYSDILERVLSSFRERQLSELLLDETNCVPIEEALAAARKKWQK